MDCRNFLPKAILTFLLAMMITHLACGAARQNRDTATWRQVSVFAKEHDLEDYAASYKADGDSPSKALKKLQELEDFHTMLKLTLCKGVIMPIMMLILCLVFLIIYYIGKSCFSIVYKIQTHKNNV